MKLQFQDSNLLPVISLITILVVVLSLFFGKALINLFGSNVFALAIIIFPLFGILTSIVGVFLVRKNNLKDKVFAWIVLMISLVLVVIALFLMVYTIETIFG